MIDVGVIGIQGFGKTSVELVRKRTDARVAAVCDVNEEAVRRFAGERDIPHVFTDYRALLGSGTVQAVVIATPHFLHCPMTLDALDAGVHVFCEKPLANTTEQAREMADAAKAKGLRLSCNFSKRPSAPVRALRSVVAQGLIGECYHVNARWQARWTGFMFDTKTTWRVETAKAGGGILIGRGSHLIDSVWHILGEPRVVSVSAVTQNRLTGFEVEDFAQATLRLENGGTVHIDCSYVLPLPACREKMEYEVFGTGGGATFSQEDSNAPRWQVGTLDLATGSWTDVTPPLDSFPATPAPLNAFLDALLYDRPLEITGDSAAYISEILSAAYRSAQAGQEVPINTEVHQ